jgi:hypothetical protein
MAMAIFTKSKSGNMLAKCMCSMPLPISLRSGIGPYRISPIFPRQVLRQRLVLPKPLELSKTPHKVKAAQSGPYNAGMPLDTQKQYANLFQQFEVKAAQYGPHNAGMWACKHEAHLLRLPRTTHSSTAIQQLLPWMCHTMYSNMATFDCALCNL